MLIKQDVSPKLALLMISLGCFGVGASYTLFAPPVFISSFCVIAYYVFYVRKRTKDFITIQLAVFAAPTALTIIYTVLIDPGGQEAISAQLASEGAIYFNLFTDALPFLPVIIFAVYILRKGIDKKGWLRIAFSTMALPLFFGIFQAVFLVQMLSGGVSGYYYAKFNYVAWFFLLYLTGIAVFKLISGRAYGTGSDSGVAKGRRLMIYTAGWVVLAAVMIPVSSRALIDDEPLAALLAGLASPYRIYADNLYRLSDAESYQNHYDEEFVELCGAAYDLRLGLDVSFYKNEVEVISDDISASLWGDALANERLIVQQNAPTPGSGRYTDRRTLPESSARIWIVLRNSQSYRQNHEYLESFTKKYENGLGFVIVV